MAIKPMFDRHELDGGEARYPDSDVPFEPLTDTDWGSDKVVYRVREVVSTHDCLLGYFDTTALAFNLRVLAELASKAADHIDRCAKEQENNAA